MTRDMSIHHCHRCVDRYQLVSSVQTSLVTTNKRQPEPAGNSLSSSEPQWAHSDSCLHASNLSPLTASQYVIVTYHVTTPGDFDCWYDMTMLQHNIIKREFCMSKST